MNKVVIEKNFFTLIFCNHSQNKNLDPLIDELKKNRHKVIVTSSILNAAPLILKQFPNLRSNIAIILNNKKIYLLEGVPLYTWAVTERNRFLESVNFQNSIKNYNEPSFIFKRPIIGKIDDPRIIKEIIEKIKNTKYL